MKPKVGSAKRSTKLTNFQLDRPREKTDYYENEDIIAYLTDIKGVIREYYEQPYTNNQIIYKKLYKFLETQKVLKLIQEKI